MPARIVGSLRHLVAMTGAEASKTTLKAAHTAVQWTTLAWIAGAAVAATLIITVIVVVSRRPKSMEDKMAEFSRSLQAVAPAHRLGQRSNTASRALSTGARSIHATKGETEAV